MNSPPSMPYQSLTGDPNPGYQSITSPDPEAGVPLAAEPIRLTYWADLMRNRPQKSSMNAASCIFISAGMSIAFSVGFDILKDVNHIRVCWFIGAIIGSFIGLALVERCTKRLIYFLAIGLVSVNGLCFTCAPGNYSLLTLGRYCDGVAFGITLPAFIAAASEQSVNRFRAMTLSIEQLSLTVGIFVRTVFTFISNTETELNRGHGIFVLVYVCGSLLSNLICTMESPVYHLRKGNEAEAINVLHSLRKRLVNSNEVPDLLAEHKQLLEEDATRGMKANFMSGLRIFPKILGLFLLTTMSYSVPILFGLMAASLYDITNGNNQFIYFFVSLRLVGVIVSCYALDTLGRRGLTAFSLFAGGILLIIFGTMFAENINLLNIDKMREAQVVITMFQFFAGIVATASTSYLGEAFPISVKPYFIVISLCLGCLIQILLVYTFEIAHIDVFAYIVGAVQAVFAGYFFFTTHETKETTLRGALAELSKPVNLS